MCSLDRTPTGKSPFAVFILFGPVKYLNWPFVKEQRLNFYQTRQHTPLQSISENISERWTCFPRLLVLCLNYAWYNLNKYFRFFLSTDSYDMPEWVSMLFINENTGERRGCSVGWLMRWSQFIELCARHFMELRINFLGKRKYCS